MKRKKTLKMGLSEAEGMTLGALLKKARFPLPRPVFDGWVENLPHVAFELAIVRRNESGNFEVWMMKRGQDDPFWPGEWHMPGTIIWQNELARTAYRRLVGEEVSGTGNFGLLRFVGTHEFPKGASLDCCRRGHEIALIHLVEFKGEKLARGKFFPLRRLPPNTVPHHLTIATAVRVFLEYSA